MAESLYAKYLKERTNDLILETDEGFVTYRYLNDTQVYIVDIYVLPEHRKAGVASKLADSVCVRASRAGHTEVLGSVAPNAKGATDSLKVLLAYGMELDSATPDLIIFRKKL